MGEKISICNGWKFTPEYSDALLVADYDESMMEEVRIPHTVKETPLHYFDEEIYQMVSGYRYHLKADSVWQEKRIFVTFDGAAHEATVFLNGHRLGVHSSGYTAFTFELTKYLNFEKDNVLAVRLDSRETLNVPPFGHVVDYMTFGGIYREVYLTVTGSNYIKDVTVTSKLPDGYIYDAEHRHSSCILRSNITIDQKEEGCYVRETLCRFFSQELLQEHDPYTRAVILGETHMEGTSLLIEHQLEETAVWDIERPALYVLRTELIRDGEILDVKEVRIGLRDISWKSEGFFLNGRRIKIRGLNRHQSFPYVGYAMPRSMQRLDADFLKRELGVNAVRTSHYPQSHHFIDRCDELGLLVFMEFPGWQHIGDAQWKEQALINLEEMIVQYRNHTSIIIWGVRINESSDDDEFYEKTNALARKLDPSRVTGGVRAGKKGHLLEDVYTYNDFSHDGKAYGCEAKEKVTSDVNKPYLITEYNGHMYPTKSFDAEEHRSEHAIRHANVLDAVAGHEDITGSFGWCMFDYNTHKDFGSGDKICYHGVMDMFRNPKPAAAVYASQAEDNTVLEISSSMDIGEHPACIRGDTWIFTNADAVRMYKNDVFIKEYTHRDSPYQHLPHGPILIDDFIGNRLHEEENFSKAQADQIKLALNTAAIKGLSNLPFSVKWIAVKMMVFYRMKPEEAVKLFNKYIGDWGGKATDYKFEAIRDGKVVKTVRKQAVCSVNYHILPSSAYLNEADTYDVAEVRIHAVDENGNILPYYNEPVRFETSGAVSLIGPEIVSFSGGMIGTYVKTNGAKGNGTLRICDVYGNEKVVTFHVS